MKPHPQKKKKKKKEKTWDFIHLRSQKRVDGFEWPAERDGGVCHSFDKKTNVIKAYKGRAKTRKSRAKKNIQGQFIDRSSPPR